MPRLSLAALLGLSLAACHTPPPAAEARFDSVQERGAHAMGFDQTRATHRFDALPDGGRIEITWDADDPEAVGRIRAHLQEIAGAFAAGDFTTPAFIHEQEVPGADVLAARRDAIRYVVSDLPRGGELRITSADPEVVRALRDFMAFQRHDHRAGGMEGDDHSQHEAHGQHAP